ncbi:cytochrome c oxidase subunit 3 [Caenispirillum salinarum]|uniref:cytochrome c oxidase subunit 3 n=1 Tax=Caenispirillum salinarum TaxID=859058 RepID=UPI00384B7771
MSEVQANSARKHPYHIVDPSPWPFLGSLGVLVLAVGAVQYFHDAPPWVMLAGFALVLVTMFGWWRDVVKEGMEDKAHTAKVRLGLRMGMGMFIASEVMFFVAFFWAYFNNAFLVSPGVTAWPPEGIETLHAWGLPAINTAILLTSGVTLMFSAKAMKRGSQGGQLFWLGATIGLGVIFLILQMVEYGEAAFGFTEGIYPSVFYMATGFHGFHVFVGVCFLAVMFARAWNGHFVRERHSIGYEASEWYWHFVDVVWLFLFVVFYWWVG